MGFSVRVSREQSSTKSEIPEREGGRERQIEKRESREN